MFERICIVYLINLVFFYRTLKFTYCSDDVPVFNAPPNYKNKLHKRFLQLIASARINPKEDHAITTVLHATTCALIYLAFGHNNISFLTAILFTFCPVNSQCSVWVSGRWYVLAAIMLLASYTYPYFSPLFLFIAAIHPAGWFSPFVFIGSPKWYLALIALPCLYYQFKTIKFMVKRKRDMESVNEDKKIDINRVVVAIKTYGFYALLTIIPFKLTFYHNFLQSMAGNDIMRKMAYKKDKFFYIGLALLAFLIYSAFGHWNIYSWGVLWYTIAIAPYTNLYRCQQEIAERYCYIASIGLMFALANLIIAYPIIITAFIVGYAVRLWVYMPAYQDDYWLLEYAVAEDPGAWYAWHTRALKRWNQGCVREALNMWVMAKLISPKEFKLLLNIGVVLKILGQQKEAESFFAQAEQNIIPGQEVMAQTILIDARGGKNPLCT